MAATLQVLSIESAGACDLVRDAVLQLQQCRLSIVTSFRKLCVIGTGEEFEIVILNQTLGSLELHDACCYVRRKWPKAKILVIARTADTLEDSLYDDRAHPGVSSTILLGLIEDLATGNPPKRYNPRRADSVDHPAQARN